MKVKSIIVQYQINGFTLKWTSHGRDCAYFFDEVYTTFCMGKDFLCYNTEKGNCDKSMGVLGICGWEGRETWTRISIQESSRNRQPLSSGIRSLIQRDVLTSIYGLLHLMLMPFYPTQQISSSEIWNHLLWSQHCHVTWIPQNRSDTELV